MKLRTLKTEFNEGGFTLKQVDRKGDLAIYSQSKGGKVVSYEVVRIRTTKPHPRSTGDWDMVEVYPNDEGFGTSAFTVPTLKAAKDRLEAWSKDLIAGRG